VIPHLGWSLAPSLLATAASCTIVIIAQSAATSRSYAKRYNDSFSENRDMVGLAMANVAATMTGTFIVNGSPTKTEMVDMAGGRSQVAQLTTAAITLVVLLFLTRPLSFMPEVVLSAVVFLIGVRLIDLTGMRDLYRLRRDEFWIAALTALTVVLVGVKQGILVAAVISIIDHLGVSYHPPTSLLKLSPAGEVVEAPVASYTMALPGLMIYRFEAPLYYANADFFLREVLDLIQNGDPALRWFVVRFSRISDVDYSASKMLTELIHRSRARRLTLVFCDVDDGLRSLLKRYGILDNIGNESVFNHLDTAIQGFRDLPPPQVKRP
jgi:MFS superfamily sulfate permease-like transporter